MEGGVALKGGDRPIAKENDNEIGHFEDEFEDEFDSEEEIFEAGVDGRPDEEREAEERRGMWNTPKALCEFLSHQFIPMIMTLFRRHGRGPANLHTGP